MVLILSCVVYVGQCVLFKVVVFGKFSCCNNICTKKYIISLFSQLCVAV